mgnify:FL=1
MSRAGFPEPMSGFDQIAGRFVEGSHPYASVPTLAPSAYPCNRSGASASFATLLLLSQLIVCCIHRLNLQPIPAIQVSQEPPVSENQVLRTWTPRSGHWRVHTTGQLQSFDDSGKQPFERQLHFGTCRSVSDHCERPLPNSTNQYSQPLTVIQALLLGQLHFFICSHQ